ncbi:MAG: hypothetical protein HQM13_16820 [SAR324 cluster bacterium]|nr:hypothetical protein [SAR324 cluster bacterium]
MPDSRSPFNGSFDPAFYTGIPVKAAFVSKKADVPKFSRSDGSGRILERHPLLPGSRSDDTPENPESRQFINFNRKLLILKVNVIFTNEKSDLVLPGGNRRKFPVIV